MDIGFNIFDQGNSYLNSQYPLLDQYLFPSPEQLGRLPSSLLGVEKLDIPIFAPTTLSSTFTVNSPLSGLHPLVDTLVGASPVVSAEAVNISLLQVGKSFGDFLQQPNYLDSLQLAFGSEWEAETATAIITDLAQGHNLPAIEVVTGEELQAQGAFSQQTNTIYLAQEFVAQNPTTVIAKVLTEEIGHYLDSQLNPIDTPGDEGELFAALVDGIELTPAQLQAIKAEDDHKIVTINGQTLLVEQSVNEIVGTSGRDVLTGTALSDRIIAGAGADLITGGLGADTFVYQNIRDAGDTIKDFELRQDVIDVSQVLSGFGYQGFNPIADGYIQFSNYTGGTVVLLDSDGKGSLAARPYIYVEKVTPTDLSSYPNHFIPNPGEPPQIQASLVNDTGVSESDRLTFDSTIQGKVTTTSSLVSLKAGLNNQPVTANIFDTLQSDGSFSLTSARLRQINGGTLNDGAYTLKLQATDNQGNISSVYSFNFVLDTTAPVLNLQLDPNFDSAPVGDLQTKFEKVNLLGTTEANLAVSLQQIGVSSTSNNLGQFTFANISLIPGSNLFTVLATDLAGNQGTFSQTFQRLIQPVNAAPTNLNLNPASSAENVLANSLIGTFTTTDPDVGDTHIYSLVTGAGDTDNAAFAIVGNELRIKQSPDFETKSAYSVRVRTQDAGGLFFDKAFSISITNVNEAPTALKISNSAIAENILANSIIGTFSSTDPDISDTHSYSLISGNGDADNAAFAIANNKLQIKQSPNFEAKSAYSVRVRTTDAGGLFFDKAFDINITNVNEAPAIALPQSQSVAENTNLIINGISISDVDAGSGKLQVTVAANQGVLTLVQTTELTFITGDGNTDGSLTFTGTLTAINQALTGLIYRGNPSFSGNDTITVTVNDLGNSGSGGALTATNSLNVTVNSSGIVLREDNFFLRNYEQSITIPATTSVFSFTYSDLNFDTTDPDSIKDAFEVALVDAQGDSLVHTIKANRDAFLNITESQGVALAAGATIEGQTVKVNLAGLAPGTAKVIFRLVNNDSDTNTTVRLSNIQISPAAGITPVAVTPEVSIAAANSQINFQLLSDVSSSFTPEYRRTSFNEDTKLLYADIAVKNVGTYIVDAPLVVGIKSLSDPSVQVVGADGITPEGLPFFNLSNLVADGSLDSNEQTLARTISFFHPQQVQFDYELVFLGQLNIAPKFVSDPDVEALVGKPYIYEAKAEDANKDILTYSLLVAPEGMVIERATGKISWTPAASAVGNYSVTVQVADGRGGVDQQDFVLGVMTPPPNRSPLIISTPIVDANVNQQYKYQVVATDPDGDTLAYSLAKNPQGMLIDTQTGLITWKPPANQVGEIEVTLRVQDDKGGSTEQTFNILTQPENGNHAPVIISEPPRELLLSGTVSGSQNDQVFLVPGVIGNQVKGTFEWIFGGLGFGDGFRNEFGIYKVLNAQGQVGNLLPDDAGYSQKALASNNYQVIFRNNQQAGAKTEINLEAGSLYGFYIIADNTTANFVSLNPNNLITTEPLAFFSFSQANPDNKFDHLIAIIDRVKGTTQFAWEDLANGGDRDFNDLVFTLNFPLATTGISPYQYEVKAVDPDEDYLNYSLIKAPEGALIDQQTGKLLWYPQSLQPGKYEFTVQVEDKRGGVDTQNFFVETLNTAADEILGTVWDDINGNGVRDVSTTPVVELVNNSSQGYYNNKLGDLYPGNPNNPLTANFPGPNNSTGDPTLSFPTAPNISSVNNLGSWLSNPGNAISNGSWSGLQSIPGTWTVNDETAIIYEIDGGNAGISDVKASFGVDNGIFVWVNGQYKLGATASGFSILGEYQLDLGDLAPGKNYIQVLREDHGGGTGYDVRITGTKNNFIEPGLAGVNVYLDLNNNEFLDSNEPTQITTSDNPNTLNIDETGQYKFTGLNPGNYIVREVIPRGYQQTFPGVGIQPDFYTVNLKAGEVVENINFGNQKTGETTPNKPPVFTSAAPTIASVGELLRYDVKATDPDGDRLTFDLPVKPEGMAVDPTTGILIWQPTNKQTGTYDVILRVQDGFGGIALQPFPITVAASNTAPVFVNLPSSLDYLPISFKYNWNLQQINAQYPKGDNLTLGGIPFNIPTDGNNIWHSFYATGTGASTFGRYTGSGRI
ncbi:putative Ig domain-containing protein [Nostoc sp. TCL26-01]|uniref:putative Ig domain-containing protein n=1 Tax=Nostoc sp. TCL26-01 TaxID=2576904 RepID=UPI001C4B0A86|nr:putative Ig domain-containing protein [Nostoc sp. TCL26-01]